MLHGSVLKVTREDTIEDIKNIFGKMKECGHNTVVIWPACFWWEPKSEMYPFATGVKILEAAKEYGLKIIMELAGQLTAMEYMPDFKFKDEYYARNSVGHIEFGQSSFGFVNYFHPEVNEIICDHFKKAANAYKDCEALLGYDVFNETMYWSFDEYTMEEFRTWLKEKYCTLDELNRVWERTYSDWSQVTYQEWMWMSIMPQADYAAFRKASIGRFLTKWCNAVREVDSNHILIADNIHSMATPYSGYTRPQDDFDLANVADQIGMSFYPKSIDGCMEPSMRHQIFDAYYAASKRNGFYISEMQTHIQAMYNPTTAVRPHELKSWCMEAASAGAKAIIYWMWRPFSKGLQTSGRGLVDYKDRETERFYAAKNIQQTLDSIGDVSPVTPKIGIVYDDLSEDFQHAYTSSYGLDQKFYVQTISGAYKAMFDNNIRCDIVKLHEIKNYKAIIIAGHIVLDEADAKLLKEYADNGGIIIADYRLGQVDKTSMMYKTLPGGPFNDYMGMDYMDANYTDIDFTYNSNTVKGSYSRAIAVPTDAEVVARFNNGDCAISKKGNVFTINTDLWYDYMTTNDKSIKEFANTLAKELGLKDIETNSQVQLRICENNNKYFVFAFNYTNEHQTVDASIMGKQMSFEIEANDVKIIEVAK